MTVHKQNKDTIKPTDSYSSERIRRNRIVALMIFFVPFIVLGSLIIAVYSSNTYNEDISAETTSTVTPEVVVSNLDTPWSIVFSADGKMYFSERKGSISVYSGGQVKLVATLSQSVEGSEEGLQGLALHPNFSSNGWLYAYYTYNSGGLKNRVVRFTLNQSTSSVVSGPTTILDNIPGYRFHNGGRIKFGPDGKLYIATGAATPDTSSQSKTSLGGKILRVNDDGSGVADNPFPEDRRIYSMGHRNPQGLAWHPVTGELWSTEHGPSSSAPYCCNDEVNKIVKGGNYGWPRYYGLNGQDSTYSYFNINHIKPVWTSGTSAKWAPGGAMFYSGNVLGSPWTNSLIFAGLGGIDKSNQAIFRLRLGSDNKTPVSIDTLYKDNYGRIRDITQGPDGAIYFATSNRDGRGTVRSGDDKIIRLKPVLSTPTPTPPPPAPSPPPPSPSPTPNPAPNPNTQPAPAPTDNVFGKTKIGSSWTSMSPDAKRGSRFIYNGPAGKQAYQVGGYVRGISTGSASQTFNVAIYSDQGGNPGTLLSQGTTNKTLSAGQAAFRADFSLKTPFELIPGKAYWLMYHSGTVAGVAEYAHDSSSNALRWQAGGSDSFGDGPSGEAGSFNTDNKGVSIWALYRSIPPTPSPGSSPDPTPPRPPISIPGANPSSPVNIPAELDQENDGTIIADFNGDGLNDVAIDSNNDGFIDPEIEILTDGINDSSLTNTDEEPLSVAEYKDKQLLQQGKLAGSDPNTITIKAGPLPEAKISKPVAYTFLAFQGLAITGVGVYLAITKLAIFAGLRGRLGL